MEKVTVKVAWCDKNFGGTFGDNVPGAAVFTARTFAGLRQAAEETLRFHVEGMAADGEAVPQWLLGGDYDRVMGELRERNGGRLPTSAVIGFMGRVVSEARAAKNS